MKIISAHEFHNLCHQSNTKLLESDKYGPKVLETSDGNIIKLFRYPQKNWLSSNFYHPYAIKFYNNALRLLELNISAPNATFLQYCSDLNTYVVCYKKIDGKNVRSLLKEGKQHILYDMIRYLAYLHQKGIFFRAIHLSNILYKKNGGFALLDVADLKFKKKSLSFFMRYRNLKHLFLYHRDKDLWKLLDIENYLQFYFQLANLSVLSKKLLSILVRYFILAKLKIK